MKIRFRIAFLVSVFFALLITLPEQVFADMLPPPGPRQIALARQTLKQAEATLKRAEDYKDAGKQNNAKIEAKKAYKLAEAARDVLNDERGKYRRDRRRSENRGEEIGWGEAEYSRAHSVSEKAEEILQELGEPPKSETQTAPKPPQRPRLFQRQGRLFGASDIAVLGFVAFACFYLRRMTKSSKNSPPASDDL